MIKPIKINIIEREARKTADIICDEKEISITLKIDERPEKTYKSTNFYKCFGLLRADNKDILFLCKGSKTNVHPSSMASQMSLGLKAYELTLGKNASLEDIVDIFDYEENNLTNDPNAQRTFFLEWIKTETSA